MTVVVVMTQNIPDPGDHFPLDAFLFGFESPSSKVVGRYQPVALDVLLHR
jgi:hypothetical protein